MAKRLIEFDVLRSIAIVCIVLYHLPFVLSALHLDFITSLLGGYGLSIFVFISGYLLSLNNPEVDSYAGAGIFYRKRLLRIYPLYWAALITFLLVFGIIPALVFSGSIPGIELNGWNILVHFLGLEGLLAPTYATPIFTIYFIGIMLMYYALFPLFKKFEQHPARFAIVAGTVFMLLYGIRLAFGIIDVRFFYYYFCFAAGILSLRWSGSALSPRAITFLAGTFLITGIAHPLLFAGTAGTGVLAIPDLLVRNLHFITGILLLIPLVRNIRAFSHGAVVQLVLFVSLASYCVYLFHRPVLGVMYGIDIILLQMPGWLSDLLILLVGLPLLFAFSYLIQKWEIELHHHFRLRKQRRSPPATPAE